MLTSTGSITGAGVVSGNNVTLDSATGVGTGVARINTAATIVPGGGIEFGSPDGLGGRPHIAR